MLWQTPDVVSTTDKDRNLPNWPANVGVLGKTVGRDSAPIVRDVSYGSYFNLTGQKDSWLSNKQGRSCGLSGPWVWYALRKGLAGSSL